MSRFNKINQFCLYMCVTCVMICVLLVIKLHVPGDGGYSPIV